MGSASARIAMANQIARRNVEVEILVVWSSNCEINLCPKRHGLRWYDWEEAAQVLRGTYAGAVIMDLGLHAKHEFLSYDTCAGHGYPAAAGK